MEILELFTVVFATYRMAHLFPKDDGPFFVFKRIRSYLLTKEMQENDEYGRWANLSEAINCVYCVGLYAALFCSLVMLLNNFYGNLFLLIMAIAGGQSLLEKLGERE